MPRVTWRVFISRDDDGEPLTRGVLWLVNFALPPDPGRWSYSVASAMEFAELEDAVAAALRYDGQVARRWEGPCP